MPKVADHHRWKDKDHVPSNAWPEDCYVQWGSRGAVLRREGGGYRTAFFEAFPKAGGFIRGEGETIAAAEEKAFATFRRESACAHAWSRKDYTNGGTICRTCGAFRTTMKPVVKLGHTRRPLEAWEIETAMDGGLAPSPLARFNTPGDRQNNRKIWLRFRLHGIRLSEIPAEPENTDAFEESPYGRSCRDVICRHIAEAGGPDAIFEAAGQGGMAGLFDALSRRGVEREYASWLAEQAGAEDPAP
ncbi:hypothetical protein [Defluviimonas salinarum]|uniref:Uncharacterized protein n=1 Tax=Defluviimonas salinarum TaxID=2992147 RepID=A0ABT3J5S1_9RHOB|nr:hypothetical protein [Defluviimonas salinarum]MCW3783029.1 hypothetical protein [Defluviimonas salinarum]